MAQFDLKKATVKLKDGAAHELTLRIGEGSLSYTEKKNRKYVKDRGILSSVVDGDEEPVDVKFDLIWVFLTASGGGTPTPEDFLKKRGEAAGYTSSDPDACAPYAVDIEITFDPECSPTEIETITLPDFRYEQIDMNAKDGMISVSGKCNVVEATPVRS